VAGVTHELHLAIGPVGFRLGSAWREPLAELRRLYDGYPAGAFADYTARIEPAKPWRRWLRPSLAISGDYIIPEALPMALRHGLLALEMAMNLQMALGHRRHLLIHAASVERDGKALVMTGASGSGKSTLAAMLGERGWRLMGDEFALIDLDDGTAHPFPRAVSLKNHSIAVMERLALPDRFGPLLLNTPKGSIRHFRPRADAIAKMRAAAPPALLLFPRFGEPSDIRPVGAAEVFVRLTQASTNYVALGERGFDALSRFVATVPAKAVDYPDSETAIERVERLWAELS
jgi:HprK-related kinase A